MAKVSSFNFQKQSTFSLLEVTPKSEGRLHAVCWRIFHTVSFNVKNRKNRLLFYFNASEFINWNNFSVSRFQGFFYLQKFNSYLACFSIESASIWSIITGFLLLPTASHLLNTRPQKSSKYLSCYLIESYYYNGNTRASHRHLIWY